MSSEKPTFKDFEIVPSPKETDPSGLWYGYLNKNHLSPSGLPRYKLNKEMNIGRETAEEAVLDIVHLFMVEGKLTLDNTAVHKDFLPAIQSYLKNPDPNRFSKAS